MRADRIVTRLSPHAPLSDNHDPGPGLRRSRAEWDPSRPLATPPDALVLAVALTCAGFVSQANELAVQVTDIAVACSARGRAPSANRNRERYQSLD